MKSTIVGECINMGAIVFPVIKRHTHNRQIVIFDSLVSGMVICRGIFPECLCVGRYMTNWIPCDDNGSWENVNDITIKFEM